MQLTLDNLTIRISDDTLVLPLLPPPAPTSLLRVGELRDPDALWAKLRSGRDVVSAYLYARLDDSARAQLEAYEGGPPLPEPLVKTLTAAMSALIQHEEALHTAERFDHVYLPADLQPLLAAPRYDTRAYVNRRLLEAAYPQEIARRASTGLSLDASPPLFHAAQPAPRFTLLLTPGDARPREVQITTTSAARGWRDGWTRWSYLEREYNVGLDGGATMRLNRVSEDGGTLFVEVQPSDTQGRAVYLGFDCALDRRTQPGDYPFTIHFCDVATGQAQAFEATLCLRHPESRYMNYLPNIYRDNESSASSSGAFSDMSLFARFLLGIEEGASPTWQLLGRLHEYFGAFTTSPEFLTWLATWIGLALNEKWPEMKRRLLLRRAVDLYKRRGTPGGLADYLEIYTGSRPTIQDQPFFGSFRLGTNGRLGQGTHLGECLPHEFTVTITVTDRDDVDEQVVREIINAEKPAHTDYTLQIITQKA